MTKPEISIGYAVGCHQNSIVAFELANELINANDQALDFENRIYDATHECAKIAASAGVQAALAWFTVELEKIRNA